MMKNLTPIAITAAIYFTNGPASFAFSPAISSRPSTKLYLEDHIAEMIDREYFRLRHKKIFDVKREERNTVVMEKKLPQDYEFASASDLLENEDAVQARRDHLLAKRNPEKYCMERCVATGNCEVFEDLFDFSADEVMEFCTDCVLSEEEEPCDVPEKFLDENFSALKP